MPRIFSRLRRQAPTNYQHTHTNSETSSGLGKLSILPRELRDEIYGHLFPVGYTTLWCAHYNEKAAVFAKTNRLKAAWSKAPGFNIAILLLSHIIHDEAITIAYSQGIFGFYSPYNEVSVTPNASMTKRIMIGLRYSLSLRRHGMGALPDTNVTNRIMNVEFHYDDDLDVIAKRYTGWRFNPPKMFHSTSAGPVALFSGNTVQRNSGLICLRMSGQLSYPTEYINSPLLNAIKQFTGFRTLMLEFSVWMDTPEMQQLDKGTRRASLARWVNETTVALEATLGSGTTSEIEGMEDHRPIVFHQIEFHPRDDSAGTSKKRKL